MAIAKTIGIETEYGIVHRGTDEPNPITASSVVINAYLAAAGYRTDSRSDVVAWDFTDNVSSGPNQFSSAHTVAWPANIYIRVYRTNAGNNCDQYELQFTR